MKLLLTSAGLSNKSIIKALEKILGKSAEGVKLAFIRTAANVEPGEKDWLIDNSAIVIDGETIDVVSEGVWQKFN